MNDKLTREKWMAEFCLLMACEGIDLTIFIGYDGASFERHETARLWRVYRNGRLHERCAAACVLAQQKIEAVVSSTDWQSVNAVARSDG